MKLSKILPIAAVVIGSGLAATACGPAAQTDGTKINIWATAKEEAVIKSVVDKYNETASEKIVYNFTAVAEGDAGTTLGKDPTVKGAPALFLCADDQINNLQSKNIILEIKGSYKEDVLAKNTGIAIAGASAGDKLFGFPVSADNGYFLWYNKAELAEDKVGSLEAILETAKAGGKQVLLDIGNGYYAPTFLMSPQACGTSSLSWKAEEGGVSYDVNWDNEKGVAVSEYIGSLLKPYYESKTLIVGSNDEISKGFQSGDLIAAVSGTWMEKDLLDAVADDLGAAKLPEYHPEADKTVGYQMASFAGSKVLCVNKTRPVEEQKVAVKLAQLLTTKEAQLKRFEVRATLPCNIEATQDPAYTEHVSIGGKALLAQSEFGALQAKSAQDRYWPIGGNIGNAYIKGLGKTEAGEEFTWQTYLKFACDQLRVIG